MDLMPSIDEMDLSAQKACLRNEIVNTIMSFFEQQDNRYDVCKSVSEIYSKIRSGERSQKDLSWWKITFEEGRQLSEGIKNKNIEPLINDSDRRANIRILELLMFSAKISILVESSDDHCDDCSLEAMIQLALLVDYARQRKTKQM